MPAFFLSDTNNALRFFLRISASTPFLSDKYFTDLNF